MAWGPDQELSQGLFQALNVELYESPRLHAHRPRSPLQSTTQRGSWSITLSRHNHVSCTYHSHKPITYFGFVLTLSYMQQKSTMLSTQWIQSKIF